MDTGCMLVWKEENFTMRGGQTLEVVGNVYPWQNSKVSPALRSRDLQVSIPTCHILSS